MNQENQIKENDELVLKGKNHLEPPNKEVYLYKDSGIRERHGMIPLWLKMVAIGLILWAIYYTLRYWDVPSSF